MKRKYGGNLFLFVLLFSFFTTLWEMRLFETVRYNRLREDTTVSMAFRSHRLNEELLEVLSPKKDPGETVGVYLLESNCSDEQFRAPYDQEAFFMLSKKWRRQEAWNAYVKDCRALWNEIRYFPVPRSTLAPSLSVSYTDSWFHERTYGGKRGHEGTDVMAAKQEAGVYPIVSMTDGVVAEKGWLKQGGYRIGITAPSGAYFYYAHLDSYANLQVGDSVKAGDLLGFMGNTGYGNEGTTGKFPVHLHVGIYLIKGKKEISINPYWLLKYAENYQLKYAYS